MAKLYSRLKNWIKLNIFERIIQTAEIKSNQEYNVTNGISRIHRAYKENNGEFKSESQIDENKTLKELMDSNAINIGIVFEITPADDINDKTKVRLKRPQDYEEE